MALGAFISHDVYNEGVAAYFTAASKKLVILLLNENGKPIATSAIKWKKNAQEIYCCLGHNEATLASTSVTFSNKTLTLPTLMFNYTKSLVASGSETATNFAIIDATTLNDTEGWTQNGISDNGTDEQIIVPTFSDADVVSDNGAQRSVGSYPVLMIGGLSNSPAIDNATNFYFAGATITFTEATSN